MSGMGMGPAFRSLRADRSAAQQRLARGTVRRVLGYALPHRRLIVLFLLVTVVDAGLVVVSPRLVQRIVDDGILAGDGALVTWLALAPATSSWPAASGPNAEPSRPAATAAPTPRPRTGAA